MALVGLDGRWLKVNPALVEMLGYGEQELLAGSFQDITHPDDLEADLAYMRAMMVTFGTTARALLGERLQAQQERHRDRATLVRSSPPLPSIPSSSRSWISNRARTWATRP